MSLEDLFNVGVKVREKQGAWGAGGSTRADLCDPAAAEQREGGTSGVVQGKGGGRTLTAHAACGACQQSLKNKTRMTRRSSFPEAKRAEATSSPP